MPKFSQFAEDRKLLKPGRLYRVMFSCEGLIGEYTGFFRSWEGLPIEPTNADYETALAIFLSPYKGHFHVSGPAWTPYAPEKD